MSSTIIDGNHTVTNDRVLQIRGGVSVGISGITIQDGSSGNGGGIYNNSFTLTMTNSTISGNISTSSLGGGGGIYNYFASLTLTNSTISSNRANRDGGGIYNYVGSLTLTNSTISGNSASFDGGGILNLDTLTLINSTISSNSAHTDGGGIRNSMSATANLFNATITNNQADADLNGSGTGGGVNNQSGGTFNFQNSIISSNYESLQIDSFLFWVSTPGDCAGPINSQGYNIVYYYDVTHCTIGGSFTLTDPKLGPLARNGGATQTHALLAGSPAIDAGDNTLGGCKDNLGATITTDQRGFHRPVNGGVNGLRCDIGAYEYYPDSLFLPLITK